MPQLGLHSIDHKILGRGSTGGVKGAVAAQLLPALIQTAKSKDERKLRKLLNEDITFAAFAWRASSEDPAQRLTSELHWELHETLARNPKCRNLVAKLGKGPWNARNPRRYRHEPYVRGWAQAPDPNPHAQEALLEIVAAARRWCLETDDVAKFARMFNAGSRLTGSETQMCVAQIFHDLPRFGTAKVAQWWWDTHQVDGDHLPDQAPFPAFDQYAGCIRQMHRPSPEALLEPWYWCVLQTRCGSYDFGLHYHQHYLDHQRRREARVLAGEEEARPIFSRMGNYTGSLYEHGAKALHGGWLSAPPFAGVDFSRELPSDKFGADRPPERQGRKCLHLLLPSFGFWFALGLPKRLLLPEDHMVYRWWRIQREFKRALFQVKLEAMKANPAFNAVFLAPGEWGYHSEALASEAARLMVGADHGSGRLA